MIKLKERIPKVRVRWRTSPFAQAPAVVRTDDAVVNLFPGTFAAIMVSGCTQAIQIPAGCLAGSHSDAAISSETAKPIVNWAGTNSIVKVDKLVAGEVWIKSYSE